MMHKSTNEDFNNTPNTSLVPLNQMNYALLTVGLPSVPITHFVCVPIWESSVSDGDSWLEFPS